ncbi:MAG: PD-(D/E)XK nuclease family protein, partial [Paramuribaculum sp.]|nr:PD-(D/E)XK nuclease family protein [Paramuribaculum sp.]
MKPFLQQVAEIYAANESDNLVDYCFVFPNKRSSTFFTSFIASATGHNIIAPATMTISDLATALSPQIEANRYEQLFTLFNSYTSQPGVEIDFDRFLFWGEMLLNDFNDVDRYLVDPKALFVNVKRLREISSTYLTPEQSEIIERFWGEQSPHEHIEHFWKHLDYGDNTGSKARFMKLWEVLLPLYNDFHERLSQRGLTSPGMLYRNAACVLRDDNRHTLPYRRYIFVGFNVLSTSEIEIFSQLKKQGMADFYWDFNSPALRLTDNRARRFISRNIKEFPSLYPLQEEEITQMPEISVVGVPSAVGQVKAAAGQISKWIDESEIKNPQNAIDTAVVLPDESLFIPLIHSIPQEITTLNVTMGFPIKLTPIASLIGSVTRLHLRSRRLHGKTSFFHEDVCPLLASPLLIAADREGCERINAEIHKRRLFQISAEEIAFLTPSLAPVFQPIGNSSDIRYVKNYLNGLCDFLVDNNDSSDRIGRHFIEAYRTAVDDLCMAAEEFGITMSGSSFFHLIERTVNSGSISFSGEPLAGLQIMGVLETRAIDFDNIIMLSMNERIFPRKHYTRSFIPDALRRGYGMATIDFQESIFSYYFYRLISRARNVTLLYDARRVGGAKSNEMSRYLSQLLYIFGGNRIRHSLGIYQSVAFEASKVEVRKNPRVMKRLMEFTPDGGSRNLSASAINTYINCPLEFYLRYVERFDSDDELTDYVDFSTFGTILHEVMERFYGDIQNRDGDGQPIPVTITEKMLDEIIDHDGSHRLDRLITATINRCFNRLPKEAELTPLTGETLVLSHVFKEAIVEMLRIDRANTPFIFIGAEFEIKGSLQISDSLAINVKQIIDRIDCVGDTMRFVDYKTGDDEIDTPSVEALFNGNSDKRAKALMQL